MEGSGQAMTVQIGPFANRVGAHYWNASVPSAECWLGGTPVLLGVDAKGGFGCMPLLGRPELVVEDVAWEGAKVAVQRPPVLGVWTEDVAVKYAGVMRWALLRANICHRCAETCVGAALL